MLCIRQWRLPIYAWEWWFCYSCICFTYRNGMSHSKTVALCFHRGRKRSGLTSDDQDGKSVCSCRRHVSSKERMSYWSTQPHKGTLPFTTRGWSWMLSRPYVWDTIWKFFNQNFMDCKMLQTKSDNENISRNYSSQSVRWLGAGWKTRAQEINFPFHQDSRGCRGYRSRRVVGGRRRFRRDEAIGQCIWPPTSI